jgi:hypothetical protein
VKVMLEGGTAQEVNTACKLNCMIGSKLTTAQIDPYTFIVTNLPKSGTQIKCGNSTQSFEHSFDYGAFRFQLPPRCEVIVDKKVNFYMTSSY